ncbi:hypothetical protein FZEAL_1692 [Fusarium zealandicum]|uniref:Zn(2)-C6 fungal-type domain-containing protein n=1 Tax=Fusarium zealandicum TaxID=1053134 RepID=A0A8H4USJ7_9HYPO|nr:hypothetical protein FZEAL_1692 [Fusarium zealandicum]
MDGDSGRQAPRRVDAIPTPPSSGCSRRDAQCTPTKPQLEPRAYATPVTSTNPLRLAFAKRPSRSPLTPSHNVPSSTLADSSPQQESGSDEYLSRLLRLVRYPPIRARRPSFAMADFLSSFNLGAQSSAASNNPQCDSVEGLQFHLRSILDAKATPNRAEHVSITLELRATVRFQLAVSESENGALENLNNIDPSLGGIRSESVPTEQAGGSLSRVVFANETLMNQPHDDPALQRSVAKHIISIVSSTDGSIWTVREVSRGAQGWTFTYLCRDSVQQWNRQTAKNPTKAIVGEFSQRVPDPVLHARPAFDCRGSVTIAFNRGSRAISVKYDHTPLHKTVAQLAEYFNPPPRQLGPGAQKLQQQQQKAKEKTPRKGKAEKRQRKPRDSLKAQDENGNPRKRKKKNNGAAQPSAPPDGPMIPPDYPGAPPVDGPGGPSYSVEQQQQGNSAQNQQGFSDYPQGLIGGDGQAATNGATSQLPGGQSSASVNFPVNVSAAEAARRREAANAILNNAGVDPATLSSEQFNIFSNQAPELQQESLSMLVKYGAERLRIVHPSNREGSAQANTSASTQSSQTTPSGPMTTKELVPQSGAHSNTGTDNEASTVVNGANANSANAEDTSTPGKRRRIAKSRTACFPCKARKTKCPKERPTCTECTSYGTACEYAPQKPKNRKQKSEAIVVEEEEEEQELEQDADVDAEGDQDDDVEQDAQPDASQDYSAYPQMNIGNMVTASTDTAPQDLHASQNSYFQSSSGLVLPQPDAYSHPPPPGTTDPRMVMPGRHPYNTGLPEVTQPMEQPPAPAAAETVSPTETRRWTAFGYENKTRRSLPSEPTHSSGQTVPAAHPPASEWAESSSNNVPAATMVSGSPQMSYSGSNSQRSRQLNQNTSIEPVQRADGIQQATAVSNTMMAQARKSPYQQTAVPRTTSRQSQRHQSRTPVADQTRGYKPPAESTQQHNSRAASRQDTAQLAGSSNYDYGRNSNTNTAAARQPAHGSYDRTSSTTLQQAADISHQNATMAMSMASATPSTMSTSYQTSSANQWAGSGSSGRNDRSYNNNSAYQSQPAYSQPSSSNSGSASRQNFNMRGNSQGNSQPHTRVGSNSYSQQQQSHYPPYTAQQHQQGQAANQQPAWYFQNSHNSSINPGGQSSDYNYGSWSGV